jgi:uncharacterized phage infection (PIP) family protein YhgE
MMERTTEDSLLNSSSSYGTTGGNVLTSPSIDIENDTLDGDEGSLTTRPLRSDLESGMSADVSAGTIAGPDFSGNLDSDSDAGLASESSSTDSYSLPATVSTPASTGSTASTAPLDSAKSALSSAADQAKAQASQIADQAKSQVTAIASQATDQVKQQISTHKDKAAESLTSVSQAVRQTADSLSQNGQPQIASAVTTVASQIDNLTDYLKNRDIDQIVGEVSDYARQNPQVFIGGAFLLGIAFARFLKSSQRASSSSTALVPQYTASQYTAPEYTTRSQYDSYNASI